MIKAATKKGRKGDDLEENERIAVIFIVIREGRKRVAKNTLEEIIEQESASSSATEEDEPVLKKKLIKKGPTFPHALRGKESQDNYKNLVCNHDKRAYS